MKKIILYITSVTILSSALMLTAGCGKDEAVILPERETVLSGEQLSNTGDTERAESLRPDAEAANRGYCMEKKSAEVTVYVCGEVVNPGVYTLDEGERIADAIALAGGMNDGADMNYVNQAQLLSDSQKIYVPAQGEMMNSPYGNEGEDAGKASMLVNINTGNAEELMSLPGIGEAKARLIIEYRETNGGFSAIEDIMKINGIKEGMFNKIRDRICI